MTYMNNRIFYGKVKVSTKAQYYFQIFYSSRGRLVYPGHFDRSIRYFTTSCLMASAKSNNYVSCQSITIVEFIAF